MKIGISIDDFKDRSWILIKQDEYAKLPFMTKDIKVNTIYRNTPTIPYQGCFGVCTIKFADNNQVTKCVKIW